MRLRVAVAELTFITASPCVNGAVHSESHGELAARLNVYDMLKIARAVYARYAYRVKSYRHSCKISAVISCVVEILSVMAHIAALLVGLRHRYLVVAVVTPSVYITVSRERNGVVVACGYRYDVILCEVCFVIVVPAVSRNLYRQVCVIVNALICVVVMVCG